MNQIRAWILQRRSELPRSSLDGSLKKIAFDPYNTNPPSFRCARCVERLRAPTGSPVIGYCSACGWAMAQPCDAAGRVAASAFAESLVIEAELFGENSHKPRWERTAMLVKEMEKRGSQR